MASVYKRGGKWYASYKGANGWTAKAAGTDKAAAMQIANALETSARFRREGLVDPKADALAAAEKRDIAEHLADFKRDILARKGNEKYATQTHQRAERVLAHARVNRFSKTTPAGVNDAVKMLRDGQPADAETGDKGQRPHSKASIAHHLRAVKMFSRWLQRNGRTRDDALISVKVGGTISKSERVHVRRALSSEEFERLITHTAGAEMAYGMAAEDRAMLYRVAGSTGLRQGEMRSLTRDSFDVESDEPGVTLLAAYSKRRRDDRQPITAELAAMLKTWLAGQAAGCPVFNLPVDWKVAAMLRADAAAARAAWIGEAKGDMAAKRAESAFLAAEDASGGVLDFHALRHSYITWVVASGASVSVCQSLARHSTPVLTLGVYSHPTLADQGRALAALPLAPLPKPEREAMRATGTDGNAQHPPAPVELVKKTSAISGLRLAQNDAPDSGDGRRRKMQEIPENTLDFAGGRGQNAVLSLGGGTADAEDLKSSGE
jgi:integrase